MARAYNELMDRVVVTEQMRERVLLRVCAAEAPAKKRLRRILPRGFAAAACLALLLAGLLSVPLFTPSAQNDSPGVQVTRPEICELASLQELEQTVGFPVETLSDAPFVVTQMQYIAYAGELAEVRYCGEGQTLVFRKMEGQTDPSGDYTSYPDSCRIQIEELSCTLQGDAEGYVLALWQDGTYSYSFRSSVACSSEEWEAILRTLD